MMLYRIFDLVIASPFPLHGLSEATGAEPDWRVGRLREPASDAGCDWVFAGRDDIGQETMACGRTVNGYIIRFNDLANFSIDFSARRIDAWAGPACPPDTLAHLLMDQVLPRVVCHLGRVVLHASAVITSTGEAIAFTGESGAGKSTLATAFYHAGHPVITDDCLLLEYRAPFVYALPSYPSLRLWPDSVQAVMGEGATEGGPFSEVAHYTTKRQLLMAQKALPEKARWLELERIYVLEEQAERHSAVVEVLPISGMTSIMALANAMFTLDPREQGSVKRNFESVGRVARGVDIRRLRYPHNYQVLPDVMAVVERGVTSDAPLTRDKQ
jgi:hypothetical protein